MILMYFAGQKSSVSSQKVGDGVAAAEQGREVVAFVESLLQSVKKALLTLLSLGLDLILVLLNALLKHRSRSIAHKNNNNVVLN